MNSLYTHTHTQRRTQTREGQQANRHTQSITRIPYIHTQSIIQQEKANRPTHNTMRVLSLGLMGFDAGDCMRVFSLLSVVWCCSNVARACFSVACVPCHCGLSRSRVRWDLEACSIKTNGTTQVHMHAFCLFAMFQFVISSGCYWFGLVSHNQT